VRKSSDEHKPLTISQAPGGGKNGSLGGGGAIHERGSEKKSLGGGKKSARREKRGTGNGGSKADDLPSLDQEFRTKKKHERKSAKEKQSPLRGGERADERTD